MKPDENYPDYWDWADDPLEPGPCVIFDVDGVISDANWRQFYLDGPTKDWTEFFGACGDDPLIVENATMGWSLAADLTIVLLTARPGWVRPQTLDWLRTQPVRWDLLIMRPNDEQAGSHNFKQSAVEELQISGFEVRFAIDDDMNNVEMLRSLGIPTIYHHSGYYD
jgi:hypothetical protein